METPKHLTPIQAAAFEDIAREVLIARLSGISTTHRQKAAFSKLHRADALAVAGAIVDHFGGALAGAPVFDLAVSK